MQHVLEKKQNVSACNLTKCNAGCIDHMHISIELKIYCHKVMDNVWSQISSCEVRLFHRCKCEELLPSQCLMTIQLFLETSNAIQL